MKLVCAMVVLLVAFTAHEARAGEPPPIEPRASFEDFIREDFAIDGPGLTFRLYEPPSTQKTPPSACECGGLPEGYRDAREDPVVLVESWRIVGSKIGKTRAQFTVEFRVLARTVVKPATNAPAPVPPPPHQIVPLSRIETERVIYKLRRTEDGWKIFDPPDMRVNPDKLFREVMDQYQRTKEQIANREVEVVPPQEQASRKVFAEKLRRWLAWRAARVAAIEQAIRLRDQSAKAGVGTQ